MAMDPSHVISTVFMFFVLFQRDANGTFERTFGRNDGTVSARRRFIGRIERNGARLWRDAVNILKISVVEPYAEIRQLFGIESERKHIAVWIR